MLVGLAGRASAQLQEETPESAPPAPADAAAAPATAPVAAAQVTPEMQIDLANGYFSKQDYARALQEYQKFLQLFPTHPAGAEAHYRMGECYRETKQTELAENQFNLVAKTYSGTEFEKRAVFRLGEARFLEQKFPETVEMLMPLVNASSGSGAKIPARMKNSAAFYVGSALVQQKKWSEAAAVLEPIVNSKELGDLAPYVWQLLARVDRSLGKKKDAQAIAQKALKENLPEPIAIDLQFLDASLQLEQGNAAAALDGFKSLAAKSLPESYQPGVMLGLLRSAAQLGDWKSATQAGAGYEKLPKNFQAEASYLLARAHQKQGNCKEAVYWLEKNLKDFPGSAYAANAGYDILNCLVEVGDDKKLAAYSEQYLRAYPNSPVAWSVHYLLGENAFKNRRYDEALPHYEAAAAKGSDDDIRADATYKKAWCLSETGKKETAATAFAAFNEAYPKHARAADALYLSAGLAAELTQWTQAATRLNKLVSEYSDGGYPTAWFELAVAQGHQQDYGGMEKSLRTFLDRHPQNPRQYEAFYWLGWLAAQKKSWDEALEDFNKAAVAKDAPFADELRLRRSVVYYYLKKVEPAQQDVSYFAQRRRVKEVPLEVIRWIARSQLDAFHYRQAVEAYRWYLEAAQNKDQITDAQMGIARAHAGLGSWNEALQAYRKAIANEGTSDLGLEARLGAVRAILELKSDLEPADRYLNEVMLERPEGLMNARARLLRGDLMVARKKDADAAKEYYLVGTLFDDPELSPWALQLSIEAFQRAGNMAEAQRVQNEMLQKYPKGSKGPPKEQP
ncbi:MAG: tetratricopeptide repeat protein [Verrucomicrobiae bacterium]|nr:tetratricopeptide repeat protein [Verrucomicrobiae bacterium]